MVIKNNVKVGVIENMSIAIVELEKAENPRGGIENIVNRLYNYSKKHVPKVDLFGVEGSIRSLFGKLKDYDFVHFTVSPFQHKSTILNWYLLKRHAKIGVTYYNYAQLGFGKSFIKKLVLRTVSNVIFVHSERTRDMYTRFNPATHLLMPPVTQEFFDLYKKRSPEHLSYIGRFSHDKGVDRILGIKDIVLSGYTADVSKDISELISKSKVKIVDKQPIEMLKKTKILILPYRTLDFTVDTPLIVLEAMAAGIPVLTSDVGDLSKILPEECIFREDAEIKEKIKYLESNFDEIGRILHKKAKEIGCHIEIVGKKYLEIIEKEVNSANP